MSTEITRESTHSGTVLDSMKVPYIIFSSFPGIWLQTPGAFAHNTDSVWLVSYRQITSTFTQTYIFE